MLKLLICLAFLAHGVGHVLFLAPTLRLAAWADQSGHSWLAEPLLGDSLSRLIGGVVWAVVVALFVGAATGLYLGADWWPLAAAAGAALSLLGIVFFWTGIYTSSALFALVFDVAILLVLLWMRNSGSELVGS
jgi:hypothetical protein